MSRSYEYINTDELQHTYTELQYSDLSSIFWAAGCLFIYL